MENKRNFIAWIKTHMRLSTRWEENYDANEEIKPSWNKIKKWKHKIKNNIAIGIRFIWRF